MWMYMYILALSKIGTNTLNQLRLNYLNQSVFHFIMKITEISLWIISMPIMDQSTATNVLTSRVSVFILQWEFVFNIRI